MIRMFKNCFITACMFISGIHSFPTYEQPITVIIPSYNNEEHVTKNLDSVCNQQYSNIKNIIYINDASTDQTGARVEEYVKHSPLADKFIVIHNPYNRKALMNIYTAVHLCDDKTLLVVLDGDDSFSHAYVLSHFNKVHADESVWLSYAQYINWPPAAALHNKIPIIGYAAQTPQEIIDTKNYRWCYKWFWSGLRCFRSWLFKCIKIESLFLDTPPHQGKLLPIMYDAAIMWPMMEMGGDHTVFVPDILLVRQMTPLNDFHSSGQELKLAARKLLRSQRVYPTLEQAGDARKVHNRQENRGAATLMLSIDNPQGLAQQLLQLSTNHPCCVIYASSTKQHTQIYQLLSNHYDNVLFLKQDTSIPVQEQVQAYLKTLQERHLFVTIDTQANRMSDQLLHDSIDTLERTYAYAFYFGLTPHDFFDEQHPTPATAAYEQLDAVTGVWQFRCWTPARWKRYRVVPALYRVTDLLSLLKRISAPTIAQFMQQWDQTPVAQDKVGLFLTE